MSINSIVIHSTRFSNLMMIYVQWYMSDIMGKLRFHYACHIVDVCLDDSVGGGEALFLQWVGSETPREQLLNRHFYVAAVLLCHVHIPVYAELQK